MASGLGWTALTTRGADLRASNRPLDGVTGHERQKEMRGAHGTLGSWLAAQGHSLPLIGRALNHTNASTTQVYARLDLEPVHDALEKNAALMFGTAADGEEQDTPVPQPLRLEIGAQETGATGRAGLSMPATIKR